jgi:hypothetical protein
VIPNPAVVPKQEPAPKEPVKVPEKVPADYAPACAGDKGGRIYTPNSYVFNRQTGDASIRLSLAVREWLERPSGR